MPQWPRSEADRVDLYMGASIPGRRRRFRLGGGTLQFRKRDGKQITFIRDLIAADQALARKTPAKWLGLPFEEVGV